MGAQRKRSNWSGAWVIRKNLIFLELIKIGIESWLYYFCDTDLNSLNLSYLALMSFTMLL